MEDGDDNSERRTMICECGHERKSKERKTAGIGATEDMTEIIRGNGGRNNQDKDRPLAVLPMLDIVGNKRNKPSTASGRAFST
jgi:hypothetical protein